jgi:aminoglycoside phosphotransferase (APT) family kinase protein
MNAKETAVTPATTAEGTDELIARLSLWLAGRLGADAVSIDDFTRHAEGFSWETYTLTASFVSPGGEAQTLGIAIRREPAEGTLEHYDAGHDYRVLEAVHGHSAVPVPEPLWLEDDPAILGRRFYAMRRVEGTVPVPWAAKDWEVFRSPESRTRLGMEFVEILARVHSIDVADAGLDFLGAPHSSDQAAQEAIATSERMYEQSAFEEVALMRAAFRWLRDNVCTSGRVSLVHGDYRIGNFMLDEHNRINAIFDWELAHLGDPVFDIAYGALRLYRGRSPLFSQLLAQKEFLGQYAALTGLEVREDVFQFWTVAAYVRALAHFFRGCRAFAEGRSDDLRLAAMGHQSLYLMKYLAEELGIREPPP